MVYEFRHPVPCITPLGDGFIWYMKQNGYLENDELTVILCEGGIIRHFTTDQVQIFHNETYQIKKKHE